MSLEKAKKAAKPWFQYALTDLQGAKVLGSSDEKFFRLCAFHCQQSVEKALKGFLVFHGKKYPELHNIRTLSEPVLKIDSGLEEILKRASVLTPYAGAHRYPDAAVEINIKKIEDAIEIAEKVFAEITSRIPFDAQWDV